MIGILVLGLWPAALRAADSLTVVSWGGAYTRSQVEAYHRPFTAMTGIPIVSENHEGGLARIKAQVESGEVTWDVVDLVLSDVVRGCEEGLLESLDLDALPPAPNGRSARDDFVAGTLHECGVGSVIWSTIYAYDDGKFPGAKPTTIADFFDTRTFPGKRGLRRTPRVNLELALMADGVPSGKVYELLATDEGIDRAFAKLDTIRDDIVWWIAGAQPPQLLADGEVVMTTAYNGRIFNAQVQDRKPLRHRLGRPDLGHRSLGHSQGQQGPGRGHGLHQVLDGHPASRRPGGLDSLRPGPPILDSADRQPRRDGDSDALAHPDRAGELPHRPAERLRSSGPTFRKT